MVAHRRPRNPAQRSATDTQWLTGSEQCSAGGEGGKCVRVCVWCSVYNNRHTYTDTTMVSPLYH